MPILTKAHLPAIITRYANGESMQVLAAEAKVHRMTLYRWMLAGLGDEDYHDLVSYCLVQRVAEADEQLQNAVDPCDIARARETARFARMDLERRRPSLYGPKQEIKQDTSLTITVVRLPAQGQILEGQARQIEGVGSSPTDGGEERAPHA